MPQSVCDDTLPLKHGVTTRRDGDMRSAASRRAAAGAEVRLLDQVHGTDIVVLRRGDAPPPPTTKADGWVTDSRETLGVYVADCLPLFLADRRGRAAGVFHAGWRGLADGMPARAAESFAAFGVAPSELRAWCGAHIGPCCFRVGPEVAGRFAMPQERDGAVFVDLAGEARLQLARAGVRDIDLTAPCTCCRPEEYYSYRREKGGGRLLAFIRLEDR